MTCVDVGAYVNRVDVGVVAVKSLLAFEITQVPDFDGPVDRSSDDDVILEEDAHGADVASVGTHHRVNLETFLEVPDHDGHVSRSGDDLGVFYEATAGQESFVAGQFTDDFGHCVAVSVVEIVDGAHVVHPAASCIVIVIAAEVSVELVMTRANYEPTRVHLTDVIARWSKHG